MKPLTNCALNPWVYALLMLLFCIPLIGPIAMLICAFAVKNPEVRNFTRSFFCFILIAYILLLVLEIIFLVAVNNGWIDLGTEYDIDFDFEDSVNDGIQAFMRLKYLFPRAVV